MLYRLLFALFLISATYTGQAQCNPQQYTRIFQEATLLQEKGEFIEAKNRYEAAKIYACHQQEKDAADKKVDALFEEIEGLRKQAQAARDTAEQERLRAKTVIEAFILKQSGDLAFEKDEFRRAIELYEQASRKLDTIRGFQQAAVEDTLRSQLNKGIKSAAGLEEQFGKFKHLVGIGNRSGQDGGRYLAYQAYLKAWRLRVGSTIARNQLLDNLTRLELNFPSRPGKGMKGQPYYQLLVLSAETNLILGNPERAGKRMNEILKYRPENLDFIEVPQLKQYITAFRRKGRNRNEFYLSTSSYLSSGWIRPGFTAGMKTPLGKKMHIGFENAWQRFAEKNLPYATKLFQLGLSTYGEYDVWRLKNNTWGTTPFQVRSMVGLAYGQSNFQFAERQLPYFLELPEMNGQISTVMPVKFTYDDMTLKYKEHTNDFLIECTYTVPSIAPYFNAFAGLNCSYAPFPRYPALSLYAALTYHWQVSDHSPKTYALKDALRSHFESQYQLSPDELANFSANLEAVGIDNNFQVKSHYPEYNSGLNLKLGLLFRL